MKTAIITLALSVITLCSIATDKPSAADQKRIQGTWIVESVTQDGKAIKDFADEIVFTDDQLTMRDKSGKEQKGSFKLDSTKKPKTLVLVPAHQEPNSSPGQIAYELSGDKLKLVTSSPDKRPTEVSDKGQVLITLKRKKP